MGKRKKIVQERDDIAESVAQKNEKRVKQKVAKVSKKLVSAPLNEESDEAGSESGSKEFECSSEYIEAHDEESEKSNDNISGTDNDESGESSDDNSGDEQNIRQKRKKGKKDDPSKEARTIFIGNVPISVTTKELKKKFQQFGKIESIRFRGVIPSKPTIAPKVAAIKKGELSDKHRNSSIAYIVFKEEAECNKALSMNGQILDDHHLRVGKCTETQYPPSLSVFVGNLPAKVKEEDLWNFFGEDSNIKAVRVVRDKTTGKGKGVAFVMFESKDNVALALEKNNLEMNGRKIRVQRCQAKSGERMSNTHNRSKFRRKFHSKSGVLTNKAKKPKLKKMRKMKKALAKRQHIVEVLNKS